MKNKNLKLEAMKVESFVTILADNEQNKILAGMNDRFDFTSLRVFC